MFNVKQLIDGNAVSWLRKYKQHICAVMLLFVAALIYIWNTFHVPFGSGYDEIGHAAYIRTIAEYHRIPTPLSGWATFHPPFYYVIASFVWRLLEPAGPDAVIIAIRLISSLSILAGGLLSWIMLNRLKFPMPVILLSMAILLTLPPAAMAASWVGNEAFTAAVSSLACVLAVLLSGKHDVKLAFLAGLCSGLAFASKYTGIATLIGIFAANVDLSARRFHGKNFLVAMIGFLLIAVPVSMRNMNATGTIFPMTRGLAPIARIEARTNVERSVRDYLTFDIRCLSQPILYDHEHRTYNGHMRSVWGLTYAGLWYDPFEHRLPGNATPGIASTLPWLGIFPTAVMLFGFYVGFKRLLMSGLDQAWLPLLAISAFGFLMYIYWTWHAHTLLAVKGSYLLPFIIPAAAFFALGLQSISGRMRYILIVLCSIAALVSGISFIEGWLTSTPFSFEKTVNIWMRAAYELPYSGLYETLSWWMAGR